MELSRQTNCVYHCRYHLVLVTKYRRKIFNNGSSTHMEVCFKTISEHYPELIIHEFNHDQDHIHLLVSIPPKMSVGQAVRVLKINSARSLKKKFEYIRRAYWGGTGLWSDGYFVSTVGINEETIRKYIEHQGAEDSGQAKLVL